MGCFIKYGRTLCNTQPAEQVLTVPVFFFFFSFFFQKMQRDVNKIVVMDHQSQTELSYLMKV